MSLKPGDTAPDFELPDDKGGTIKLSDQLAKGPLVLFFYPKAMTPGCTKESCHFRDLKGEFDAVGAQRLGISADPVNKQQQFSEKHGFDFPLVSDTSRTVARAYGVKRAALPLNKRVTFVIDTDRKLLDVIASETNMDKHADQALAVLKARASG